MISVLFDKKFYIQYDTLNFMPKQEKVLWKFDDTTLAKRMKFLWLVFFPKFSL